MVRFPSNSKCVIQFKVGEYFDKTGEVLYYYFLAFYLRIEDTVYKKCAFKLTGKGNL